MADDSISIPGASRSGHPPCARCAHIHRETLRYGSSSSPQGVTYDLACPCGCVASGSDYERAIVNYDLDSYRSTVDYFADDKPGPPSAPHADDYRTTCATHYLHGSCADHPAGRGLGRGDDSGKVWLVKSSGLRGGWMGRVLWAGLSRFARHQRYQLVWTRGNGDSLRGRPDPRSDADSDDTPRSGWLRSVVSDA